MKAKKIVPLVISVAIGIAVTSTVHALILENEIKRVKEDVRQLTNDIDTYGDIDTYTGSGHFERLYEYSHNK